MVPDDALPPPSPDRPKRRLASQSPEAPKRARVEVDSARRRTGLEEEKKRGKRLFGALLGTIGKFQKDSTSARARSSAVKRSEVEAKMQEKMKAQTEELEGRRRQQDESLNLRRRVEARDFEERVVSGCRSLGGERR